MAGSFEALTSSLQVTCTIDQNIPKQMDYVKPSPPSSHHHNPSIHPSIHPSQNPVMTHLWFISVVDESQLMNYQGLRRFCVPTTPTRTPSIENPSSHHCG
jgi:hypothetical protein